MKKLFAALFAFVFVLTGCGSNSDVYTYTINDTLESLDTAHATYSQTFGLFADVYMGLTKINGDGELENAIADSIDVSDDGLTYTFHLRDDYKWVDNTGAEVGTVTAGDFEYAWKRIIDPATASNYSYIFEPVKNAQAIINGDKKPDELGVKAIDDTTLEVTLETPTPYFTSLVSFGVFAPEPKEAVEQFGDDYGTDADKAWYNGPYYVTAYDTSYITTVQKNPLYVNADNVQVETIDYRVNQDATSRYNAFLNGEVNYAEIGNPEDYTAAKADGTVTDQLTGYSYYAVLNNAEGSPTSNPNLRKALSYGFDRDSINEATYGDINKTIEYLIPKDITPAAYNGVEYHDYSSDSLTSYDKDKADKYFDAYMKDMGYTDRSQIEINFLAAADASGNSKTADALQASYQQTFGITVDTTIQPSEQFRNSRASGAFDMYISGWGPDYADPSTYLSLWQTNQIGSQNYASYSNKEYDKLYAKANSETDVDARFTDFAKLEKMLIDDGTVIPFYQKNAPYMISDGYTQPLHLFLKISHEYLTKS